MHPVSANGIIGVRTLEKEESMKVLMVLYPCPSEEVEQETPAELLGCADKALGLREWIEGEGHELGAS
jgi:hypothetical protein